MTVRDWFPLSGMPEYKIKGERSNLVFPGQKPELVAPEAELRCFLVSSRKDKRLRDKLFAGLQSHFHLAGIGKIVQLLDFGLGRRGCLDFLKEPELDIPVVQVPVVRKLLVHTS